MVEHFGMVQSIHGSHHPNNDSTVDLGHSGARWRQIHATNMYTTKYCYRW